MKTVTAQAALPGVPGQRQHLFHIGQRVVKGGVKACHLRQFGVAFKQCRNRFERKRLVQRRERNVAAQVGQHLRVHAHRVRVFGAAMHHAVHHRNDVVPAVCHALQHACTDVLQRGVVGVRGVQRHWAGGHAGFAKGGRGAGDAIHFAVPKRFARQGLHAGVKQRELDARRATVQDQNKVAHSGAFW